jgi:hypothetical protein
MQAPESVDRDRRRQLTPTGYGHQQPPQLLRIGRVGDIRR